MRHDGGWRVDKGQSQLRRLGVPAGSAEARGGELGDREDESVHDELPHESRQLPVVKRAHVMLDASVADDCLTSTYARGLLEQ